MPVESPICYLNGSYLPLCDASIPLEDLAILRGYGVFEFLRTYSGIVFEPESHFERLHHSASKIGMSIPWTNAELLSIITETVARNRFAEVGIRLIITGGRSADGKHADGQPSLAVIVKALLRPSAAEFAAGVKAITIRLTKDFPTAKSISYAGALMALGRAEQAGRPRSALSRRERCDLGRNDGQLLRSLRRDSAHCPRYHRGRHYAPNHSRPRPGLAPSRRTGKASRAPDRERSICHLHEQRSHSRYGNRQPPAQRRRAWPDYARTARQVSGTLIDQPVVKACQSSEISAMRTPISILGLLAAQVCLSAPMTLESALGIGASNWAAAKLQVDRADATAALAVEFSLVFLPRPQAPPATRGRSCDWWGSPRKQIMKSAMKRSLPF